MKTISRHQEAEAILERPLEYPGLRRCKNATTELRLWKYPAFTAYRSWSVHAMKDEFFVRRVVWDQSGSNIFTGPQTYAAEASIPAAIWTQLRESLTTIQLPPFMAVPGFGIDGVNFGVEVGSWVTSAKLSWWCDAPAQWKPLSNWLEAAILVLDSLLPASSVDVSPN